MKRYVMVFRGEAAALPDALDKVRAAPGLRVLRHSSSGAAQVEWAGDESSLCAAIVDCGIWLVSEERLYQLC